MDSLVIAVGLLWLLVIALAIMLFALARQIGVLFERVAPMGALVTDAGPKVGEAVRHFDLASLDGRKIVIGAASPRAQLVFFLSPTCPVCKKLLPLLPSIQASEATPVNIVLASDGEVAEHTRFAQKHSLDRFPYVLSQELGMAYQIGKLPYAVLLDESGKVRAKGLVNSREHLESLFEARELGVASLQQYVHGAEHEHHEQHA
jgi:methylamine dehydrogenase accessory protein MauD